MIDSGEISVIVQGTINKKYTKKVLYSIRRFLPHAEIILSTWNGSNLKDLDYDILVENIDPGAVKFAHNNRVHNLNRQIVSTSNGIKKATRKYVLKIRTDVSLENVSFLKYWKKHNIRSNEYAFLKERVLICNRFARKPEFFPFHISDWVFFGLKEDIENIWDIPLAPEPDTTEWFYEHKLKKQHHSKTFPFSYFRHRYCAEQYIWSQFLKKYIDFKFEDMFDITDKNIELTEKTFANNLVILSKKQYGIIFLKGDYVKDNHNLYDYYEWLKIYKKHCDNTYIIKEKIRKISKYENKLLMTRTKLTNNLNSSILPIKVILKWFVCIFSVILHCIRILFFNFRILTLKFFDDRHKILLFGKTRDFESCLSNRFFFSYKYYKWSVNGFLKYIYAFIPKDIDDVYIVRQSTGEVYMLANVISQWIKNNNSKNPLIVGTRKYHKDFFDLYTKESYKYIYKYISPENFPYFKKNHYKYKGKNFYIYLDQKFLYSFITSKNSKQYVQNIVKYLKCSTDSFCYPNINSDQQKIEQILQENNISNNEDFVVIYPKSCTVEMANNSIWKNIENKLAQNKIKYIVNNEKISFKDMIAICEKSKGIIASRTGAIEYLVPLRKPMHILYSKSTRFGKTSEDAIKLFTLTYYPLADTESLYEYNIEDLSQNIIIDMIIEGVKNAIYLQK